MRTKVIGLDIAPGKDSHLFGGQRLFTLSGSDLIEYLDSQNSTSERVLICCDAPLTGPQDPDGKRVFNSDHTQRGIETFFRQKQWGYKTPKGISVLGYSACLHWSITRKVFGLPRTGKWDTHWEILSWGMVTDEHQKPNIPEKAIIEVHPAVALWLWNKDKCSTWQQAWNYKAKSQQLLLVRFTDNLMSSM